MNIINRADDYYELAAFYFDIVRAGETGLSHLREAVRLGHTTAMLKLASIHENNAVYEKAYKLRLVSSQRGNVAAFAELGRCYEKGIYVKPDSQKALFYYHIGASLDDCDAEYRLARILEKSCLPDAASYYERAAQKGHKLAMKALARYYPQDNSQQLAPASEPGLQNGG